MLKDDDKTKFGFVKSSKYVVDERYSEFAEILGLNVDDSQPIIINININNLNNIIDSQVVINNNNVESPQKKQRKMTDYFKQK